MSLFCIATRFIMALPPTVMVEVRAVTIIAIKVLFRLIIPANERVSTADRLPLTIPQISPITSLQKEAIVAEFLIKPIASLAPFIFLEAIAWKLASLLVKTATPIISKIIPIKITKIVISSKIKLLNLTAIKFDIPLKSKDRIKVNKKTL